MTTKLTTRKCNFRFPEGNLISPLHEQTVRKPRPPVRNFKANVLHAVWLQRGCEAVGGRVAYKRCTFLLPSSSSSSLALLPTSLRMGLCRGDGAWPGRLRVDIWKEGDMQRGPLEVKGESWGLSTTESVEEENAEIKDWNCWLNKNKRVKCLILKTSLTWSS